MQQPEQYYINENQNCGNDDLDEITKKFRLSMKIGNFLKLLNRARKIIALICL